MPVDIDEGDYQVVSVSNPELILDVKRLNPWKVKADGIDDQYRIDVAQGKTTRWNVDVTDDGDCAFITQKEDHQFRVDLRGQCEDIGTPIIGYDANNTDAQKWDIVETEKDAGTYYILYHEKNNRAITVLSGKGKDNIETILDKKTTGNKLQQWKFI